jgi:hypothetical protein
MASLRIAAIVPALLLASASAATSVHMPVDPLRFFAGRTESVGRVKVMMQREYATRSSGVGRIERDGSLTLVQQVFDAGKPPHQRTWRVRQLGPDRYAGTMTEAAGPVAIERVGERYRFRFKMKGGLKAEEILTPLPGGRAASNTLQVRKFGMVVATSSGVIRKIG